MKLDFFKKIFYPLEYLSVRTAGVVISNHNISYFEFANEHGRLSVKNFGQIPLPDNTVKDGDILDRNNLTKILAQVKERISVKSVNVSIPEEKTYIFETKIPKVNRDEIRQALEFRLEENVPFKSNEVYFEYEIIGEEKDGSGIHLSVSVIQKKVIEDYTSVIIASDLYPVNFEIESRMLSRAVVPKRSKKNYVVVNIKGDTTIFSFVEDNVVRFTSTITTGENYIRESLLKTGSSIEHVEEESIISPLNVYSIIKDELEKFVDYLRSKSEENVSDISEIVVCGKSASLPGFLTHIGQNLDLEIIPANVWINIFDLNKYLPPISFQESLGYGTAIGLAIPFLTINK